MSWVEEIGEKELSDRHAEIFVNLAGLMAESSGTTEEAVKNQLNEYIDTAIINLEKIRKANNGN